MNDNKLHLKKLRDLVAQAIEEEQLLSSKLIEADQDSDRTFGQKVADKIADFGGSWTFILSFLAVIAVWISINVAGLNSAPFDPYPLSYSI